MFKTRIQRWGCDKKRKQVEMVAILRKAYERASEGKMSQFSIRGRPIALDEVHRYFARKGRRIEDIDLERSEDAPTPKAIKCDTPITNIPESDSSQNIANSQTESVHASAVLVPQRPISQQYVMTRIGSIPQAVPSMQVERSFDNFLHGIKIYYSAKLCGPDWILGTVECDDPSLYPSMQLGSLFLEYHDLRTLQDRQASFKALDKAFTMIKTLLIVQDPRLLTYLLESIAYTRSVGYEDLARQLIWYFTSMAIEVLGRMHPISMFGMGLHQASSSTLSDVIERGLGSMVEQFVTNIGDSHLESMRLLLTGSAIMKHQKSYVTASRYLTQLLPIYEYAYGVRSYQTCHALIDKAYLILELGDAVQAERLMEEGKHRAEGILDSNEYIESNMRSLSCKAHLRRVQGNFEESAYILETALLLGEMALDDDHWMMRHARADLIDAQRCDARTKAMPHYHLSSSSSEH
jgi:hypothetical protein